MLSYKMITFTAFIAISMTSAQADVLSYHDDGNGAISVRDDHTNKLNAIMSSMDQKYIDANKHPKKKSNIRIYNDNDRVVKKNIYDCWQDSKHYHL